MKTFNGLILILVIALGLASLTPVYAGEAPQVATDHLAQAAVYEQRAQAQDALIAEHTQMKQDYRKRFFVNEKVSPMRKIKEMENHCDAIIKDASSLKVEFLELAKWHRMRAAELEGR